MNTRCRLQNEEKPLQGENPKEIYLLIEWIQRRLPRPKIRPLASSKTQDDHMNNSIDLHGKHQGNSPYN